MQTWQLYSQTYPNDDIPTSNLLVLYARLGDYESALKFSLKGIQLAPDSNYGYLKAARAYDGLGRFEEAKAIADESIKKWAIRPFAHAMMYLGSHRGRLLAIDLSTQKVAWYFETEAAKKNGSALTTDKGAPNYEAAFADNFYDDIVVGLQKMLSIGAVLSSPAISGDTILFGSTDGNLYAIQ